MGLFMNEKISVLIKIYRVERFFYTHSMKLPAKLLNAVAYLLFNCQLPPSAVLEDGVNVGHAVGIVVHHNAQIGKNTKIYQNVTIGGGPIKIGENCFIGAGAVVLADLGDNVKVGANAVVLKSVPSNCTVVGFGKLIFKSVIEGDASNESITGD